MGYTGAYRFGGRDKESNLPMRVYSFQGFGPLVSSAGFAGGGLGYSEGPPLWAFGGADYAGPEGTIVRLFEEPICAGWVYPCSLEDIRNRLTHLPEADLTGLWAVGLAAATRKDCSADGRYCFSERPTIRIYSYPDTYTYRQPPQTKHAGIDIGLAVEREFGMEVDKMGGRYVCRWTAADLKRFTLEHVLLHEVGHHVYHWRRKEQGHTFRPSWRESEQSAESYALRHVRR